MLACDVEGGGGVGAKCLAVITRTWCRSVRASLSKRKSAEAARKADDGPVRLMHLSVGTGASTLPASIGPTGKRSARKRAGSVWSGGKAAKPYLSLSYSPPSFASLTGSPIFVMEAKCWRWRVAHRPVRALRLPRGDTGEVRLIRVIVGNAIAGYCHGP